MTDKRYGKRNGERDAGNRAWIGIGATAAVGTALLVGARLFAGRNDGKPLASDGPDYTARGRTGLPIGRTVTVNRPRQELYDFWRDQRIADFDAPRYHGIIELAIAGNGYGGVGRYNPGGRNLRVRNAQEKRNQRFLIQIIPKIGQVEL